MHGMGKHVALLVMALANIVPRVSNAQNAAIGYYDLSSGVDVNDVPWPELTHLNVAFAGIDQTGQCNWVNDIFSDAFDTVFSASQLSTTTTGIASLVAARNANNPNVKILLSVGGAGLSYRFSEAVSTSIGTWTLAWSCWNLMHTLGLDGIDYDWEYPGRYGQSPCPTAQACSSTSDTTNLAQLLSDTRYFMGNTAPLSVAVHNEITGSNEMVNYDYAAMDPLLTFWNVMVYELAGSWSNGTQLQAPYSSAVSSMGYWAQQSGVTASKVILGVPYYSKYWGGITADEGLGTTGGSSNNQGVPFSLVGSRCAGEDPAWECSVTTVTDGAYCYCSNQQIWYTYDGPAQMEQKASLVASKGYGGVMFWQLPGDSADFSLTQALIAGAQAAPVSTASAASVIVIIL
jgi:chitinase